MRIDVHAHLYPRPYVKAVEPFFAGDDTPASRDVQRILGWISSDPRMWSVDDRLADLERFAITTQVLSVSLPNVYLPDKAAAVDLCQMCNDSFIETARAYPGKFRVFASVPLHFPQEAMRELDRVAPEPEVVGVILGANVAGRPLDSAEFLPFYAELERRELPFFIHPMSAPGIECMMEFGLANLAGYLFDTTLAALRLVFAGVFERHPRLQMIFPHLGGVAPYLLGRVQWGYERFPFCREHISSPPETYFRRFYYDTVSRSVPALKMAIALFGVDHLVFGTDYPFRDDLDPQLRDIEALGLSQDETNAIFSDNTATVLRLDRT